MIAVTGIGLLCALGTDPQEVTDKLLRGESAVRPQKNLEGLPFTGSAPVSGPDLKDWLRRRKDQKLMARPTILALPAAGRAISGWPGDPKELGLFVGVGREPPDEGEAEAALVASHQDGQLRASLLATEGLALYPPLLPLKTLPNMALAHLSIVFGIQGENGALAGEGAVGLQAIAEACLAIEEGRVPAALAGATDSCVSFPMAWDRYRMGQAGSHRPPGEGAIFLLLEPLDVARRRGARILGLIRPVSGGPSRATTPRLHWPLLGDLGAADGLVPVLTALVQAWEGLVEVSDDDGGRASLHLGPLRDGLGC